MLAKTSIGFSALLLMTALAACDDDPIVDPTPMVDAGDNTGVDAGGMAAVCFDEAAFFTAAARSNTVGTDPGIDLQAATPTFQPADTAPVLQGGATPADDGFFDATATFIGAVGSDDWTAGWTAFPVDTAGNGGATIVDVEAQDITADTTWSAENTYVLKGKVFVTGATLTIEPGTVIRGETGSALVITKDGDIVAEGTAAAPIVFTSSKDTGAAKGDWGGVVLIGDASINIDGGTDNVEGFENDGAGKVEYGGTNDTGSCGSLRYVRIEYAGFELSPDNELNGLTVAGCGSGTTLDFVQVHRGQDDGIELFGGTANLSHVVVSLPDDDGIDWDYGWRGKGQFLIVMQDENNGDKGFESDNNGKMPAATPVSSPTLWNVTLIGGGAGAVKNQGGMHLRRGTAGSIKNAIITNFKAFAVDVDSYESAQNADAGDLTIEDSYFYQNAGGDNWPTGFDVDSETSLQNDCAPSN